MHRPPILASLLFGFFAFVTTFFIQEGVKIVVPDAVPAVSSLPRTPVVTTPPPVLKREPGSFQVIIVFPNGTVVMFGF